MSVSNHPLSDLHTAGNPFSSVPGGLTWKPSRNSRGWAVPEQGNRSPGARQGTEAVTKGLLWEEALRAAL